MIEVTTLTEVTLDGRLALSRNGSSKDLFQYYEGVLSSWFHEQRANHDAIMVGAETVRADDPLLTVRHAEGVNPLRVIPTSSGNIPLKANVLSDGNPTLLAIGKSVPARFREELQRRPWVEVIECGEHAVDLVRLMRVLEERGVRRLVVEGGSQLLHSLFGADLVSRMIIKHIPVVSGALEAPSYLEAYKGAPAVPRSKWKLIDLFAKSGVAVTIYERP